MSTVITQQNEIICLIKIMINCNYSNRHNDSHIWQATEKSRIINIIYQLGMITLSFCVFTNNIYRRGFLRLANNLAGYNLNSKHFFLQINYWKHYHIAICFTILKLPYLFLLAIATTIVNIFSSLFKNLIYF